MRLRSLSFRGLVRFKGAEPVSIDLDALGPGLVALVGDNGEGKTTAMEAVAAALYKELPSRDGWYGTVTNNWHGRDAFVEAVFEDRGDEIRVRVQVDAEVRKTERYLFVNGRSATTGRAKEADQEILRRFGSYDLFLASILGSQKRTGNFLDAVKGERKERFAELLGLARIQAAHERAKERLVTTEVDLREARQDLADAELQAQGFDDANQRVARAQKGADAASHQVEAARTEEGSATVALERARGASARIQTAESSHRTAAQAVTDCGAALEAALDEGPRARQEAARARAALERQQDPDVLVERANEKLDSACRRLDVEQKRLEGQLHERPELVAARDKVAEFEEEIARLQKADRDLAAADHAVKLAVGAHAAAEQRVRDAEARVAEEQQRLATVAARLDRVPCTATDQWIPTTGGVAGPLQDLASICPLLADARTAKERGPRLKVDQARLDDVAAKWDALKEAQASRDRAIQAADPLRLGAINRELPPLRAKAAKLAAMPDAVKALESLSGQLLAAKEERERDCSSAEDLRKAQAAERTRIEADLEAALAAAAQRETDARARVDAARQRVAEAALALTVVRDELGALSVTTAEADLSKARGARYEAEQALRTSDRELAAAVAARDVLAERQEALPGLRDAVTAAGREVGDWSLLAQALGKDGIQALEIDAAGPEVARLANDLLEACYGTRWTISFETLREKRSSPGEYTEAFDVRVYDRGHERAVEGISGGERVIVGEAVALALAIYTARKSGIDWKTVFRDETAGALSPGNAGRYADMLRRALRLGGFYQIVFIAHQVEVNERADVQLLVSNGTIRVAGQAVVQRPAEAVA